MAKKRVKFTFPQDLVTEPIIYWLGHKFPVITNIRFADVGRDFGWVILEVEGEPEDIERGLQWVAEQGVRVDPVTGDVVEG